MIAILQVLLIVQILPTLPTLPTLLKLSIVTILTILPILPILEEVPVKRMDRQSATETERGSASETDCQKSAKNMEMPLK